VKEGKAREKGCLNFAVASYKSEVHSIRAGESGEEEGSVLRRGGYLVISKEDGAEVQDE